MNILLTGASSFTGAWFVRRLAEAGHTVTATFTKPAADYTQLRGLRVRHALQHATPAFNTRFGDPAFLALVASGRFDLICHHAADVTDYNSPAFDVVRALSTNLATTHTSPAALFDALAAAGRPPVLLTGSVFESDEGAGERDASGSLAAFNPYGLSKALTWHAFRHYALARSLTLGKFVIPNPFGPLEEPRFTAYLVKTWRSGQTASVKTPAYVRDNLHVSLMSLAYARFAQRLADAHLAAPGSVLRLNPSGYAESQGAFSQRFAREMEPRLGFPCRLDLATQTVFDQPRVRINTDLLNPADFAHTATPWDEARAWDDIAAYYQQLHANPPA